MAFFSITFAMAFVDMHIFSRDFLHFDMSLLLSTFTFWGVSNKHWLLSLFSFQQRYVRKFCPEGPCLASQGSNSCWIFF